MQSKNHVEIKALSRHGLILRTYAKLVPLDRREKLIQSHSRCIEDAPRLTEEPSEWFARLIGYAHDLPPLQVTDEAFQYTRFFRTSLCISSLGHAVSDYGDDEVRLFMNGFFQELQRRKVYRGSQLSADDRSQRSFNFERASID